MRLDVPKLKLDGLSWELDLFREGTERADCALVVTGHSQFDYKGLRDPAKLIVDTRKAMKAFLSEKIIRL